MSHLRIDAQLVGAQYDFYHDDTTRFLHLSGGFGSGKSTVLVHKLLKLSMLNAPFDGGLVVPTFADFKNDILPIMEGILGDNGIDFEYHGTDHKFKFPWSKGYLRVFTADRKLRGPNLSYIGINELCLIPVERYLEAIGRVRVKDANCSQIVSSSTPEGHASPYYEIFVEKPWKNSRILYMNTAENAHNLDPNYIQSLLDSYPKQLIDAYLNGLWVSLSNNRFYFSYTPENNDFANVEDPSLPYLIAMDFNVDPFCSSIWQFDGHTYRGLDEVVLSGGDGYKTENMIKALQVRGYNSKNSIICPDPSGKNRNTSGKTDVEILQHAGYEVRARAAAPRFRERQINMNALLEKRRILVHSTKQPKTKKDLIAVEMDPVNLEKVKRNPSLTHLSDGLDYLCDLYTPFNPNRTNNRSVTIR